MKIYSIVRIDDAYVVRAGETGVLKVGSRRRAVRLVSDAEALLATQAAKPLSRQKPTEPSIARDAAEVS
jgi:hypothetical protein